MKRSFDAIDESTEHPNIWGGDAGIDVLPSQVPKYLWDTVFYNGLNINDDDPFVIPAQNMKASTSIYSLKDAEELLNTARYWGLEEIPASLLSFTMSQKYSDIVPILKRFVKEYPVLNTYLSLVDDRTPIISRLEIAMELGSLEAIKALRRQPKAFFTARGLSLAAEHNHMDCLRYALSSQRSIWKGKEFVFRGAVRNGHLKCIEQLRRYNWSLTEHGNNLASVAAAHNQYDVLDYLCVSNCSMTGCANAAAERGHLNCLEYALLHGDSAFSNTITRAAAGGHLNCVKFLRAHGCAWEMSTSKAAAEGGHLECLKYLHEQGCPWDEEATQAAVRHSHLLCLHYLHENGCPWVVDVIEREAVCSGNLPILQYLHRQGCTFKRNMLGYISTTYTEMAAMYKRWDCVQYLIANGASMCSYLSELLINSNEIALLHFAVNKGCPLSNAVGIHFARTGNLYQLRWAYANKCGLSANMLYVAAKGGHFRCLQFIHEACLKEAAAAEQEWLPYTFHVSRGSVRLGDIPAIAATEKHWKCLEYLVEQGYPTDKFLSHQLVSAGRIAFYHYAVERGCHVSVQVGVHFAAAGDLEELKYAFEHGCDPSEQIVAAAVRHGHVACMEYALQRSCPWVKAESTLAAADGGHLTCLEYAYTHEHPWPVEATVHAARGGSLPCLIFAHQRDGLWTAEVTRVALQSGHRDCFQYAVQHGCPVSH